MKDKEEAKKEVKLPDSSYFLQRYNKLKKERSQDYLMSLNEPKIVQNKSELLESLTKIKKVAQLQEEDYMPPNQRIEQIRENNFRKMEKKLRFKH